MNVHSDSVFIRLESWVLHLTGFSLCYLMCKTKSLDKINPVVLPNYKAVSFCASTQCLYGLPWWLSWLGILLQCRRPGLGQSPGEENGYPLQYSGLESSMDCIAHEVAKSPTWLCNFHFQHLWLKEESEPGFWSRCLACWLVAGRLGLLLSLPLMTHLCFPKLVKEAFRQPELLHLLLCKWLYNSNRLLR